MQNWTLVIGVAFEGPYVGTVCRPPVGVVLGEAFGDVVGRVDGDGLPPILVPFPRFASTITPTVPRMRTIATAIAAGTSQAGRSDRGPPPGLGRCADGLRAGAEGGGVGRAGAGEGAAVADRVIRKSGSDEGAGAAGAAGAAAATGSGTGRSSAGMASPVPSGSAGTTLPGVQAG